MRPQPLPPLPGRSLEAPVVNPCCFPRNPVSRRPRPTPTPLALLVVLCLVLNDFARRGACAGEYRAAERGGSARPSSPRWGRFRAALVHWLSKPDVSCRAGWPVVGAALVMRCSSCLDPPRRQRLRLWEPSRLCPPSFLSGGEAGASMRALVAQSNENPMRDEANKV